MKKYKGVLTLEAALIMPLVIYIVILMIMVSLLIYNRVFVALTTNHAVTQATSGWYDLESDFGGESKKEYGVIANAISTSFTRETKKEVLRKKIKERIKKYSPIKVNTEVNITPYNYLVGEKLDIEVICTYNLPLPGLFKLFGVGEGDGTLKDSFKKNVMLSNTESNMRTVSYVSNLLQRDEVQGTIQGIIDKIKSSLKGVSD